VGAGVLDGGQPTSPVNAGRSAWAPPWAWFGCPVRLDRARLGHGAPVGVVRLAGSARPERAGSAGASTGAIARPPPGHYTPP